jgi:tetratricopeptide (TPR) repeat protein
MGRSKGDSLKDDANSAKAIELATVHHMAGRLGDAEALYRGVLTRDPRNAEALHKMGIIALQMARNDVAVEFLQKAIAVNPNLAPWHDNLGVALLGQGKPDEAIAAGRRALALQSHYSIYVNLARAMLCIGALDEALVCCRNAIALNPDYPAAHWNLGLVLLTQGNYQEGWKEYAWRTRVPELGLSRQFPKPHWDGGELNGRRILLHAEQGAGDTLQFVRYIPMVRARGGKIILECQSGLHSLLRRGGEIEQCVITGQPLPDFDVYCSLLSLPILLATTLQTIPRNFPYVMADPVLAAHWQARLADEKNAKVGLVWAGRAENINDRNRSITLASLAPLAAVPDVTFISLQTGAGAEQAKAPPAGMKLIDWTGEFRDFSDTAALLAHCDLVITVDTAVAHLAGAMGKPVWVLLPYAADWRWMIHRVDSPWYPSAGLFRQPSRGNWSEPIARLKAALENALAIKSATANQPRERQ